MSYSSQAKAELCGAKLRCPSCRKALLYGMLLFDRSLAAGQITLTTESRETAALFSRELAEQAGVIVTMAHPSLRDRGKRPLYLVSVEDEAESRAVYRSFFPTEEERNHITERYFQKECCKTAFLRGAWLACGTMSNPQREYHFEFSVSGESLKEELLLFLEGFELDFHWAARGKGFVVYVKDGEQLEDVLARLGAVRSSMQLMNLRMEKGLRNQVNRQTNCETANISKTINAALSQIEKITCLQQTVGLETLPPPLREAAQLRLQYPDASLRELAGLSNGKLSRSGLNHRLQKLCELADSYQKRNGG